jgi:oligopeptidase A
MSYVSDVTKNHDSLTATISLRTTDLSQLHDLGAETKIDPFSRSLLMKGSLFLLFTPGLLDLLSVFSSSSTIPILSQSFASALRGPSLLRIVQAFSVTTTFTHRLPSAVMASTIATDVTMNPLLQYSSGALPKFASMVVLKKEEGRDDEEDGIVSFLTPSVEDSIKRLTTEWSSLEESLSKKLEAKDAEIAYDDVVPVLERIQYPISYIWGIAGHLNGVRNSPGLRTVYEANQPVVVQTISKFQQSQPLYNALLQIQKQDTGTLTAEQRRAVELSIRSMKLGGVGLEDPQHKERFNEIKQRLASLSNTFSNNVLDATKAFSLTVTDKEQLKGVPQSAMNLWSMTHKSWLQQQKEDDSNVSAEEGPWRITLDMPSYLAVMQHVSDRTIRETVYRVFITRASEFTSSSDTCDSVTEAVGSSEEGADKQVDGKNNIPLIYEILNLKQEMAKMLGYPNYAEMSLASKMAPSIQSVTELADLIAKTALPAAQKELDEITSFAREKGGISSSEEKLQPWDVSFWSERLKESKFEITEEETRPYFALPAVLKGMFALVERLFNVRVVEADAGEVEVWHEDVQFFKVYDKSTNEQMAGFYLDPYSRPENKRGGAWMDVCIGKSAACNNPIPVAYLTCNGSPPVRSIQQPSLMTFREVETLFHEFGHGLQHMLTTVSVGDVAGINGVEWDAVELPSQFMENWCYDRPTVYGFARHWETGTALPEDMFEKLKAQKTYNAGMMACRQLLFGQLDLELHAKYDPSQGEAGAESIFAVHRRMAEQYTPYSPPLPEDRFLCSFSHIFAGGYAAGYYSYKWAEVMSADAFGAFEETIEDEEQVQAVGRRFRDTVLSLGGSVDPMTVFRSFRGREPNPEALLRHNGLIATA